MDLDLSEIQTKLSAARTRLILEKPFIGSLVMHLPLVAADADWCKTSGTDARAFYYNPHFINSLTLSQTQFVLAHEALHCALGHFARRNHRVKQRWDVACDHAVNLLLVDEGLKPPPDSLLNLLYKDLTAEEIYPFIQYGTSEKTLDNHMFDGEAGDDQGMGNDADMQETDIGGEEKGDPSEADDKEKNGTAQAEQQTTPEADTGQGEEHERREQEGDAPRRPQEIGAGEREDMARQWRSRLASAAQQARQAGKLGESWLRTLDELLQPKLPWRMLLARYMISVARDDYSFQRVSRREGEALLPSLHSGAVNVVIALDTSGSILDEEMREFVAEVDALKGQIRASITLHACDERLCEKGPWIYEAWEPVNLPQAMSGGGGTRFTPIFEWVEKENLRPNLLLYFTDAEGEFPKYQPAYPVIWLVKGKAKVPWGQRIQLN